MQESGVFSPEWWFTVVVVGLIIGVVGSIIANRTDRRLDKYLGKYSERRRQNSEERRLEFERDVAGAKISDVYRAKLLADLVTNGVGAVFFAVLGLLAVLLTLALVELQPAGYVRTAAGELLFFSSISLLPVFVLSLLMSFSRILAVFRTNDVFHALSKEETSKDPNDSE